MAMSGRTGFRHTAASALFSRASFLLACLFMFAWSGQAAATSGCEIQPLSSTYQQGDAGTTLNYSFNIVSLSGGCSGTISGTVTRGTDTTGGASPVSQNWSGTAGSTINVIITLGGSSGGQAQYSVDCAVATGCFNGNNQIDWTAVSNSTWQLVKTTAPSFTVLPGQSANLGVKYTVDNVPTSLGTTWSVDNPSGSLGSNNPPTDSVTGHADNTFYSYASGTYTITVEGDCPILVAGLAAPTTSCPPNPESFTVVVEDPVLTPVSPSGGTATIAQNTSINLSVKFSGATIPVPGADIGWNVTSEPSAGDGTFTGETGGPPSYIQTTTNGSGVTQVTFNVTAPGTYTVDASYCPDGCEATTSFTITVLPVTSDISVTKTGAPAAVSPGGQLTYTINVANAGPDPGVNLSLTDTLPAQLSFVSLATPVGWQCSTPAPGSGGTVSCTRNTLLSGGNSTLTLVTTVAPTAPVGGTISNSVSIDSESFDPVGSNDNATAANTIAASAPSLAVSKVLTGTDDNDASGSVSAGDQLDYEITATNNGNISLSNVVVSDDHFPATQSCPSLAPSATCVLTGSYIVTAGDVTAGSVTNVGSATSTEVPGPVTSSVVTPIVAVEPALAIGSGDGQSAPPNTPFADPLTVIAGGSPPIVIDGGRSGRRGNLNAMAAPGVTISWAVISGSATLSTPTSVTNASGIASNNAFAGPTPGPVVIRATRNDSVPGLVPVSVDFNLTVTALPEEKLGDLPGLTENQKALADALDELCNGSPSSGGGSTESLAASTSTTSTTTEDDLQARCQELIDAIGTDPSGVIDALDQLFADIALIQSESSLLAAQSQFDNIKARIAALRSGTNRTGFGGLAFQGSSGRLPVGSMFQGLLDQDQPAGAPTEVGSDFSRWGFFAAGTIGRGDAEAGDLSPAYDFDIGGLTVGADYRVSDKLIFGGTLGYTRQDNDLRGSDGALGTRGWSISAYGTWYQQDSWYMDGVFSYGRNSYDIERRVRYTITGPSGTTTIDQSGHANGDGDSMTFALSLGRDFNKNGWGFGPYLRAMYTNMSFDPLVEEFEQSVPGVGLALVLDSRDVTSLSSTLGGKLTYAHSTSWGVLIPHVQLEWQHEFQSDPSEVEARFLFDPLGTPFTIKGDPIDTDFFRFGVGMSFVMAKGRSGFFYYERLLSRERFSQDSLALGIRIEF